MITSAPASFAIRATLSTAKPSLLQKTPALASTKSQQDGSARVSPSGPLIVNVRVVPNRYENVELITESQIQPLASPPRLSHVTVLTSEPDPPAAATKGNEVDKEKSGQR